MVTMQNKKWTGRTKIWAFPGGVLKSPDEHTVTCCCLPSHSASVPSPLPQFLSLTKKSLVLDLSPQETLEENESSEGGRGSESHWVVSDFLRLHGLWGPWNSPGQNTGVRSLFLLQGIFPIQGSNPGLPRRRQILYQLSHQGSPRILEWVAYPFSSRSSRPRNRTGVSCVAGGFFTNWAIRNLLKCLSITLRFQDNKLKYF